MSIVIIDGSKSKKYKLLDSFLERAYQRQQAEKEFSEEIQRKKQSFIERVINDDKLRADEKERIIRSYNAGKPIAIKNDWKKNVKIVSSGKEGYFKARDFVKDIKVEELKVKIKDDKIKEIIHGVKYGSFKE